ncbi:hypothetical protein ACFFHM_07195 [Halalkalibacter kiskunsagensis]|uniref:TFIIS-type domain-containing protein n=1 Tax=Halalkalibacter kiskunsagensis TaxID=1548599 RepID=A0ABV6KAH6_9BACI
MYYSKEELERLRKDGEEKAKEMELDNIGKEYKSNEIQVDWLNKSAKTLICKRCGYIHWFSGEVT